MDYFFVTILETRFCDTPEKIIQHAIACPKSKNKTPARRVRRTKLTTTRRFTPEFDELSKRVIEKALEVHRTLGPGMLESVYEQCLSYELNNAGIGHERQKEVPVIYKGITLDNAFRMDMCVENQLVIEIKSTEKLLPVHEAQILSYMKYSGVRTGLLINFNVKLLKEGLKRFVF